MRTSFPLAALLCAATGCSSDPPGPPPPAAIDFGAVGSLAKGQGQGGFRFGASSAATQIEDQNTATDWWLWSSKMADGGLEKVPDAVGDASMGFTMAVDDVALLTEMNLDAYRFSVEWARVEPQRDVIDEAALAHYDQVLDALVAAGIRPMLTLHHFSNPVWIDDPNDLPCAAGPTDANLCGWNHPQGGPLVVEEFKQHAELLAQRFGDRVDEWGTLNEPVNYMIASYGVGTFPPGEYGILDPVQNLIPMARNYLAGHAAAYDALKGADTVDADGDGEAALVGLPHAVGEWVPARNNEVSDDPIDVAARDRLVWVYHYLFPEALLQGALDTDLDGTLDEPHPEWAGKLDWLGVQYYFRNGVTGDTPLIPTIDATPCYESFDFGSCLPPKDPTWVVPAMNYEHDPEGLYVVLSDFSKRWPDLPLLVTESGIATQVGRRRAEQIVRALEQVDRAIGEGADVRGYYHWSLYDNFEWALGYAPRFGLYTVDYATYARTATEGATTYGEVAGARQLTSAQRSDLGGLGPMTPEE